MKIDLKREIDKSAITIFLDFNTTHPVTEKKGGAGAISRESVRKEATQIKLICIYRTLN